MSSRLLWPLTCLVSLGKCRQTGFAGPRDGGQGRGSRLLQLAPVWREKPHSFGAPHIVPARVRGTREVRKLQGAHGPQEECKRSQGEKSESVCSFQS